MNLALASELDTRVHAYVVNRTDSAYVVRTEPVR